MSDIFTAPHERTTLPDTRGRHMTIRQERAAIAAMEALRAIGARVGVVHLLPNGLGYVDPDTGHQHEPTRYGLELAARTFGNLIAADHVQLWPAGALVRRIADALECPRCSGLIAGPCTCGRRRPYVRH